MSLSFSNSTPQRWYIGCAAISSEIVCKVNIAAGPMITRAMSFLWILGRDTIKSPRASHATHDLGLAVPNKISPDKESPAHAHVMWSICKHRILSHLIVHVQHYWYIILYYYNSYLICSLVSPVPMSCMPSPLAGLPTERPLVFHRPLFPWSHPELSPE